jgi:predicted RNase H-like HicB family nuclease
VKTTKIAHLPVTLERNDDGYLASCPLIQGAFAEGDTIEEAIFNCLDVVKMILEYRDERGEPILKSNLEELQVKERVSFTIPIEIQSGP